METTLLSVTDIQCRYDNTVIIENVSFNIKSGDLCCLLGPSGSGKSTILRAIAGFLRLNSGTIKINDRELSTVRHHTEPEHRNIGMVFQDYALFPHLNVAENIAFGMRGASRQERHNKIREMLELVRLDPDINAGRYPHQLSGGEQQRVALARSLASAPQLLLLDEPFSNLDADLRRSLNLGLKQILRECGITTLLVTHDQEEAFAFADYIGVLQQGKMSQWDTPYNLYHRPANKFIARFIGQCSFIDGRIENDGLISTSLGCFRPPATAVVSPGQIVDVLLRPDDILYDPQSDVHGSIRRKVFAGARILYSLQLDDGTQLLSLMPSHNNFATGETIPIGNDLEHLIIFPRDSVQL